MKSNIIKALVVCLVSSGLTALTSCKDDNPIDSQNVTPPMTEEETKVSRFNQFIDLDIPGDCDWRVTYSPRWLGAMNEEGAAGEKLLVFVETNGLDTDRRDTIVVALADKRTVRLPIHQLCAATDDENAAGGSLSYKDLKFTYGVGYSVDVIKKGNLVSFKYNMAENSPFNFRRLQDALKSYGEEDAMFEDSLYSSRSESVTGSTTSALANQLGINAGIEVGIKAFKFSVEAGYTKESSSQNQYMYAIQEIQHITGSRYVRAGMLRYLAHNNPDVFQDTFSGYLEELTQGSSNHKAIFRQIIDGYGTHIITHGTLGGELKMSLQMEMSNSSDATKIHAALGASSKVLDATGSVTMTGEEDSASEKTRFSLQSYGGENVISVAPGANFKTLSNKLKEKDPKTGLPVIDAWTQSIKDGSSVALIDVQLMPIWDLMPTEKLRIEFRNYVVSDYQTELYSGETPDLYVISGYDYTSDLPGCDSIYIPELDLSIVAERSIVEELSPTQYSTIIYSGTRDNVNRNRGFFVGSDSRYPCKIHRLDSVTLERDTFNHLSRPQAIEKLYVDATGDITIATKTVPDMYMQRNFEHWRHDLKVLRQDWTVESDVTVTGKTDHALILADGVTLTLDSATVNNQIVCKGNATIVLKDGTENSVVNTIPDKAAIQVGPPGTTLTISGNGSLTANSGLRGAAGIGASCVSFKEKYGNIKITGGTITAMGGFDGTGIGGALTVESGDIVITNGTIVATGGPDCAGIGCVGGSCGYILISGGDITANGGSDAAAIGSGSRGKCSDITIIGGTVRAVGGAHSAGIGAGSDGTCGNITITKDVTKVIASCGRGDDCAPIGLGDGGSSCGTVTIEAGANVEQNDPNVFDISRLTNDLVVSKNLVITGTTNYNITVETGRKLTLSDATVNGRISCDWNNEIILRDNTKNYVNSGIFGLGPNLYIRGGGTLIVKGKQSPGIFATNLYIEDGIIEATGDNGAAGIGSGSRVTCGDINISGGTVKAIGGSDAAGIGSGSDGKCGKINISGGTVTGIGSEGAAGIGSGREAFCSDITISGGNVTATAGTEGAGIGSGNGGTGESITIKGGTVTATGGDMGAGIGTGFEAFIVGAITITGGTVKAVGGYRAAGIGTGAIGHCYRIQIFKSVHKVHAKKGSSSPASIGAGYHGQSGAVVIENGANVIQE